MIYIPEEWLKDKENMDKVHSILQELDTDIVIAGEEDKTKISINKLEELGESIIIEKIKDNSFKFGA